MISYMAQHVCMFLNKRYINSTQTLYIILGHQHKLTLSHVYNHTESEYHLMTHYSTPLASVDAIQQ